MTPPVATPTPPAPVPAPIPPYAPITSLPAYQAGRSAESVAAEHGLKDAIKLASNESPFGPLPSVSAALVLAATTVNRYPDVVATPLREALAERHGLTLEEITVGPGSSGVLWQLASAYVAPGDEIVMHAPAFEAYPIIATLRRAVPVAVPLRRWCTDVEALEAAVTERTKVVFLTDPHNPTGTSITADEIRWLAERLAGRSLLVVDQAYLDFAEIDGSGTRPATLDHLFREHPHTLLLRTFSKAHGLAALRVGYSFSAPQVATALQRVAPPFAVSAMGIVAACASLAAQDELTERVRLVADERRRMTDELRSTGIDVPASRANFVFLPTGERSATVVAALEERGVATRRVADQGVRVTIGLPAENDRFLAAWHDVLPHRLARRLPHGLPHRLLDP